MVERRYKIDDKREVVVNLYVVQSVPPQLVIEVKADSDTVKEYITEDGIAFAVNVDDLLDAIREALTPTKLVRD